MAGLITAIAAMTQERVIGLNGDIPWHYSEDLKHFKQTTIDHTIIMGRMTWQSLGSKPLPRRRNIVITRQKLNSVETFQSLDTALNECNNQDIWLIGGARIYTEGLQHCHLLDITLVPDVVAQPNAVKFPLIDHTIWRIESNQPLIGTNKLHHIVYRRQEPL